MPTKKLSQETLAKNKMAYNQDYQEMLSDTAHYKAEQYGFVPGYAQEEWVETENDILSLLDLH